MVRSTSGSTFEGYTVFQSESSDQILAVTVLYVPNSLDVDRGGDSPYHTDAPLSKPSLILQASPQKELRGGIPGAVLEPLGRSWSHFVGIYRQKFTKSFKMTCD